MEKKRGNLLREKVVCRNALIALRELIVQQLIDISGATSATVDVPSVLLEGSLHLPFQLQIEHTRPDGSRCMKVITRAVPTTADRTAAEKGWWCFSI